ncbi:MAG: fibronectin type III domain-containing protein, partial [Acutalibacteraceae bacterium]
ADVTINTAAFVKAPKTVNDKDIFYNSLAPDRAVYTSTEKSADTIVVKEKDINTLDKFYVDVCGHYISDATCEADGTCRSCGGVAPALGHDNTILKYNETQHWYQCTRCDHVEPAEDHDDGQEGKTATCETKPICALCEQEYGTPLGHSFTNFVAVEPARCPHNTVKVATCDNGCGKKEYNYDEATNTYVSREGKAPTCTEIGWTDELSCKLCEDDVVIKPREVIQATGHTYGEEIVDTEPTYRTTGKAHKICEVCDYVYEYELPVLEYPRGVVAVIGETGEKQYKSLFEADGAIADAEDGDTIVLVGDTEEYTPINLDKNITIDLAGHKLSVSTEVTSITATANLTVKSTVNGDGEENTAEMGILEFGKAFIQSNAEVTFDNIQAIASQNISIFASTTADDAETPAKLTVKNSVFTVTKTSSNMSPIGFTSKAVVVDFDTVTVQSGSDGEGVVLNSDVTGTFKNTIFKKAKGLSVSVKKTGADGIVFDGCNISQSQYDQNTCSISGGKCTLTGGTVVTGNNCSTTVLGMSGGTLIIDDAIIRDDKGTDSNRRLLYIGADGLDIQIKKATFSRGKSNGASGVICNDKARFIAALAEGSAMYYSEEATGECAFNYNDENATLLKEKVIYVAECKHEITTATCTEAGNCKYCNKEFAALGHDELGYASDGEYHWKACSRCGQAVEGAEKVAHSGGTATCTEPKHCEVCEVGYGEALGHDFSEGKYACNTTSHWITCSRCTAKQEGTIAEHQVPADDNTSKAATCTEAAYCAECGLSYGKELGHEFKEVDYVYNDDATCTENGTQTAKCTRCDETDTQEAVGTALGHSPVVVPAVPATCTHTGLTAGEKCATCGEILKQQADTPISKYHTWDEGKLTQQGSCQKHGVLTYTCIYCKTTEDVDVGLGDCIESADWTITKQPTETETGLRVKYCTECGKVVKTEIIPAKGVTTPTQPNNPTVQNPTSNSSNAATKVTVKAPNVKYTASKKSFKVKYTKVKNAVGFQVRYKIGKKTYTKTFNSTKTVTKVIKNLKKGTYKVQIRAFSKGKKSFSKWTKAKTVKVK